MGDCHHVDLSESRQPALFAHQIDGIETLVKWTDPTVGRVLGGCFALFDEMGAGKSRQVTEALEVLFRTGEIDKVLILAPANVRSSVWFDEELGELAKYLWQSSQIKVVEFHGKLRSWSRGVDADTRTILISNYEFIRSKNRLTQLLPFCTERTLLICDESNALRNHKAVQTKAVMQLRKRCRRVWLLNGTPIANGPGDMFSQGNLMDPGILDCPSFTQFCARYAIMKPVLRSGGAPLLSPRGIPVRTIVGWIGIDDIQRRFAPYVLRRLKKDCLDLPEKLPPVALSVPLTDASWARYRQMRDDLVVWLSEATLSQAPQAITKIMRLSQLTSGFLGGVEDMQLEDGGADDAPRILETVEVGREKQDAFFEWLDQRLLEDPAFKGVVWSRFRPELQRAVQETRERYPQIAVGIIAGGYKKAEREHAVRLLDPTTAPAGPVVVFGNPQSGGLGLTLVAAKWMYRLSSDYSQFRRAQSDDRIHRPGQTCVTSYFDSVATGPQGQKTIDHAVLAALLRKENLAEFTCQAWVGLLEKE